MTDGSKTKVEVRDEPVASRYEISVDGELAGFADYRLDNDTITFPHTEIDPSREGQGLGGRLVGFAVTDARSRGLTIIPVCPFVKSWIEKHPAQP
ncbi:MAG: N-acetyltransferase [Solirubrobacterales bacterium]|nr:N-acetyltransferase [Solirubrobacterales bacterium]HMT04545.1 GNAT family N-acetyltransferase [Solirubrobacterales bacterium]